MSLRRAVAGFGRIILRHPYQLPSPTSRLEAAIDSGKIVSSSCGGSGSHNWSRWQRDAFKWIFISGQAVIFLGLNATPVLAEDVSINPSLETDASGEYLTGLRKVEDGSVVSNLHTSKWRVFTDNGRDLFLQGKLDEAERLFMGALQEAKEGFGEMDPHVASACNNLAELYRVKKAFGKAEPLYLKAINILEESYGLDDIRVGAALHNLGQFYLVLRKLDEARACYERALKIKRRILGEGHADYAETMYHLATVLRLQGKGKDSEALILDSIRILEDGGLGESVTCIRRLRHLAQMYINSNRLADAVTVQRKILHIMEISKGWNSLDTVIVAEGLALTLQSIGSLTEAHELLERCLDSRKTLLSKDHIQIAANMLHLARVEMLQSNQSRKRNFSQVITELDKAKGLLGDAIRIARQVLDRLNKQKKKPESILTMKDEHVALAILLQALGALGRLETTKVELQEPMVPLTEAENALRQCIAAFKKFGSQKLSSNSPEVNADYLSCLRHLSTVLSSSRTDSSQQSRSATLQELEEEIKHVESEVSLRGKHRN